MDDWAQVYDRYGPLVWATVYRILSNHADALDCCQDVFTELIRRKDAQTVRNWPAYLRWLATRRAIDRLRRSNAHAARFDNNGDVTIAPEPGHDVEAGVISSEVMERFKCELSRLPEQQAEAFWLLSVEQMSYDEISEQMQVESNHVGVLVHRARQKLRTWLADLNTADQSARGALKKT